MIGIVASGVGCDEPAPTTQPGLGTAGALASSWTPPGNGVPLTVHFEPLDENGLDPIEGTWFDQPPLPLVHPATTSDCLRPLAAEAFADLPGSTSLTWVATLHDPWPVDSVDARYIAALDSSGRWGQGAWDTARNAWKADRTSATATALATLQTVVDGIAGCDIVDTFEMLSLIFKEGTIGYDGGDAFHRASLLQTRKSRAGSVCVGNGIAQIPLSEVSGFSTPLTVTAYFHDPRHAEVGSLDEIELYLVRRVGSSRTFVAWDTQLQEKMRFHHALDPANWELVINGRNVTGTSGGCGPGQQRVFFAFGWEPNTSPEHVPWHSE